MAMVDEVTETHQDAIERPPSDLSTVELNGQVPRHYKEFLQAYRALLDSRGNISLKGEVSEPVPAGSGRKRVGIGCRRGHWWPGFSSWPLRGSRTEALEPGRFRSRSWVRGRSGLAAFYWVANEYILSSISPRGNQSRDLPVSG